LCLLDENKIPNVELVVEFVGFTYANITFDQKLDSTFDLGFEFVKYLIFLLDLLPACGLMNEKCKIDASHRSKICGTQKVYSLESIIKNKI
jgi:hypothetical protein